MYRGVCSETPAFSGLPLSSQGSSLELLLILHKNNPSESESPQSCLTLCDSMNYSPWYFPGKNAGVGSLSLLQETFPTQGSNPGWSPTLQADSLSAEPQGKPKNNPKSLIKPELGLHLDLVNQHIPGQGLRAYLRDSALFTLSLVVVLC